MSNVYTKGVIEGYTKEPLSFSYQMSRLLSQLSQSISTYFGERWHIKDYVAFLRWSHVLNRTCHWGMKPRSESFPKRLERRPAPSHTFKFSYDTNFNLGWLIRWLWSCDPGLAIICGPKKIQSGNARPFTPKAAEPKAKSKAKGAAKAQPKPKKRPAAKAKSEPTSPASKKRKTWRGLAKSFCFGSLHTFARHPSVCVGLPCQALGLPTYEKIESIHVQNKLPAKHKL